MRALLTLLLLATLAFGGEPRRLILLHTNDVHGQLEPMPPSPLRPFLRSQEAGGFAHLATMVRAVRTEAEKTGASVLLLDGGDIFQGTPIGNLSKGESVVEAMNALGYDAMALGNHEFDFGFGNMLALVQRARFPVLAANMAGVKIVKPYVVFAPPKTPCRVCVIGLITPSTPTITTRGAVGPATFADPVPVVKALRREVEADLFIVVDHLGRDEELALAREVPGLAAVCGGHSHTPFVQKVGDTICVQTHTRALSLARIDLDLDPDGWTVLRASAQLLPVDPKSVAPDPAVQAVRDRYGKEVAAEFGKVVGVLAAPLRKERGYRSSTPGNWMADVIRRTGEAEIGFMNKGGIRTDLEAGEITYADVFRLMPFDNAILSMDLTGAQVRALLERHATVPVLEWSGLDVEIEHDGDARRLGRVEVNGAPLVDAKTYRVATHGYLAGGGDGFEMFREGRAIRETGILTRDALAADLKERSPLTPPDDQRIRVLEKASRN